MVILCSAYFSPSGTSKTTSIFFLNEAGRRAADYIKKKKQHPDWTKQQRQRNRPVGFGHGHSNSTRTLLNKQPIGLGHQRGRTTPLDETRNNKKTTKDGKVATKANREAM